MAITLQEAGMRIARWLVVTAVVATVAVPGMAQAQSPVKGDLAVSVPLQYVANGGGWSTGLVGSGAFRVMPAISVVGEVAWYRPNGENAETFAGGVRFHVPAPGMKVSPFVQALIGGINFEGETGFLFQPGAGVDVPVAPMISIRVQGDYQYARFSGGGSDNGFRLSAGVVIGLK
jgi:hypothetical protein